MMNRAISEKVSALRRERGLTQERLGAMLGVSSQAVSKWEKGDCLPDLLLIPQLCEALGISADELLGVSAKGCGGKGSARVSARSIRIGNARGLTILLAGELMVEAVRQTETGSLQKLLTLLADEDALRVFRLLSFTSLKSEVEIAEKAGLPVETVQAVLFRLLRASLCQCSAQEGYFLGQDAYIAYAALTAAYLASEEGRKDIHSVSLSYSD
ncbi:MAG: helix-turn-helix transcriptional regulator [Clostridia bacterium]|nr:helix-turn-helix transcriptional regulator [Clostridia bacterium]